MNYRSKISALSESYIKNRKEMVSLVEKLRSYEKRAEMLSEKRKDRFHQRGQLTPRERLVNLLDPGMPFLELYNMANFLHEDPNPESSVPGASNINGIGFISGVRSMISVNDSGINAGASSFSSITKSLGSQKIANRQKLPYVQLVESAGVNLMNYTVELWANAGGTFYGLAKLSAKGIPTVVVLHGPSTAGGAYLPGMSDYVIGVKKNGMAALAGSALLKAATGEESDERELGGTEMHAKTSGLVEFLAEDDAHGISMARDLIDHLDWNKGLKSFRTREYQEPQYEPDELAGVVPIDYKIPYDSREVIIRLVDGSDFEEFKSAFGSSILCIFATIHGFSCGIVCNNGPIDPDGAVKTAQFLQLCDKSNLPVIFLNNTTGYMVGKEYEQAGMIKHGSKMIQAVSNVRVPRITLYIGASFGAGNYGMCGFAYEPDFLFSWPNSITGVMGGEQAALTMNHVTRLSIKRRGGKVDEESLLEQDKLITDHFDKQHTAFYTSGRCLDHGIIDPRDSRKVLGFCLETCLESERRILYPNSYGIARM